MLEFNLSSQCPSFTEIIAQHNYHVRQIKACMTLRIAVTVRELISENIVTVEIICSHGLTVAAYCQTGKCLGPLTFLPC